MNNKTVLNHLRLAGHKISKNQAQIIMDLEGQICIQALAGAGKTSVITARIAAIQELYPEATVVALSYSKKSCEDLSKRIHSMVNVQVATIHSFLYNRVLRAEGFFRNCRFIANDAERRSLIRKAILEAGCKDTVTIDEALCALSKGIFTTEYQEAVIRTYLDLLKDHRLLCYDSVLYFAQEILIYDRAIANHICRTVDFALFDEAQDMSKLMCDTIMLLFPAEKNPNICMVLDYHQSIFGFRGAEPAIVKHMVIDYYHAKHYTLNVNYRSTKQILNVANSIISTSGEKLVAGTDANGQEPTFYAADDPEQEATFIINRLRELYKQGYSYSDIAILFRAGATTNVLHEQMLKAEIPFVKIGSSSAMKYSNSRFKTLLAMLSAIYDNKQSLLWPCILPVIGANQSVMEYLSSEDVQNGSRSVQEILTNLPSLSKNQKEKFKQFFSIDASKMSFDAIIAKLYSNYIKPYYRLDDDSLLEEYHEIIGKANSYEELRNNIFMVRKQEKLQKRLLANASDKVTVLSMHSAKGLQFPICFIVGASSSMMPISKPDSVVDLQQERNLVYVATTRPMEQLIVTYPKINMAGLAQEPSPYFSKFFEEERTHER